MRRDAEVAWTLSLMLHGNNCHRIWGWEVGKTCERGPVMSSSDSGKPPRFTEHHLLCSLVLFAVYQKNPLNMSYLLVEAGDLSRRIIPFHLRYTVQ